MAQTKRLAWLLAPCLTAAQTLTNVYTVTPTDVALSNLTDIEAAQVASTPFQVYSPEFGSLLGTSPSLTAVLNASFPAFHEAGVVTSLDPLTLYSSSNQFGTATPSPESNNMTIVVSRTTFSNATGWTHEIVNNNTAPLTLTNGGFQYQDGILFVVQGNLSSASKAGLVYFPTGPTEPNTTTPATLLLDNFLGSPLNSPNDVYVASNGVVYFTDPQIGFVQGIRPAPVLPDYVYGYVPGTTDIRVVADGIQYPNGIAFSPDERTVYITAAGATVLKTAALPQSKTVFAYDVTYASGNNATKGEMATWTNRRVFAVPSSGIGDGIHVDSQGRVWVGTGDGVDVYNSAGRLIGKVLVDGGIANFGFASDGRVLIMDEEVLYMLQVDASVQPSVPVGQRRG